MLTLVRRNTTRHDTVHPAGSPRITWYMVHFHLDQPASSITALQNMNKNVTSHFHLATADNYVHTVLYARDDDLDRAWIKHPSGERNGFFFFFFSFFISFSCPLGFLCLSCGSIQGVTSFSCAGVCRAACAADRARGDEMPEWRSYPYLCTSIYLLFAGRPRLSPLTQEISW